VRVVVEGSSTGGRPEAELTGALSDLSAAVLEALFRFSCFSSGRVCFLDLGVPAFSALSSEVVRCFNRTIVSTLINGSRSSAA
jgi:hypothetical protein